MDNAQSIYMLLLGLKHVTNITDNIGALQSDQIIWKACNWEVLLPQHTGNITKPILNNLTALGRHHKAKSENQ